MTMLRCSERAPVCANAVNGGTHRTAWSDHPPPEPSGDECRSTPDGEVRPTLPAKGQSVLPETPALARGAPLRCWHLPPRVVAAEPQPFGADPTHRRRRPAVAVWLHLVRDRARVALAVRRPQHGSPSSRSRCDAAVVTEWSQQRDQIPSRPCRAVPANTPRPPPLNRITRTSTHQASRANSGSEGLIIPRSVVRSHPGPQPLTRRNDFGAGDAEVAP